MDLDRYSLAILAELQRDARQTVQQLSAAVGLSPTNGGLPVTSS